MNRNTIGGGLLLLLAAFMLVGMLGSSVAIGSPAGILAALITIVLPAAGGIALLRSGPSRRKLDERRDVLRRQTIESEVLRLAASHQGRLTVVEVMTELALTQDDAKEALDALMRREMADIELTPAGMIVYNFHDVRRMDEKSQSKGLLE
jgi:hypothetical protein